MGSSGESDWLVDRKSSIHVVITERKERMKRMSEVVAEFTIWDDMTSDTPVIRNYNVDHKAYNVRDGKVVGGMHVQAKLMGFRSNRGPVDLVRASLNDANLNDRNLVKTFGDVSDPDMPNAVVEPSEHFLELVGE